MIRVMLFLLSISIVSISFSQTASGYVFHDLNKNGIKDDGEEGLPSISVSNGTDVVQSD